MKAETKQRINSILHKSVIVLTGATLIFCIYMNNVLGNRDSRVYADRIMDTFFESITVLQNGGASYGAYVPLLAAYNKYDGVNTRIVNIPESEQPQENTPLLDPNLTDNDDDFWEDFKANAAYNQMLEYLNVPMCMGTSFDYNQSVGYWLRLSSPQDEQQKIAWISCNIERIRSAQSLYKEANRNLLLLSFMYFGVVSIYVYSKSFPKGGGVWMNGSKLRQAPSSV